MVETKKRNLFEEAAILFATPSVDYDEERDKATKLGEYFQRLLNGKK